MNLNLPRPVSWIVWVLLVIVVIIVVALLAHALGGFNLVTHIGHFIFRLGVT
jgi:hypothetical protein